MKKDESTSAPTTSSLTARIAQANTRRIPGTVVAGMVPNAEQEAILALMEQVGLRVVVIGAGAGTGKTATLKMLEQVLRGRGQYTAFNKSLVEDSRPKFVKASVNTTHSLAHRAVGRHFSHRLGKVDRMRSSDVARHLGIAEVVVEIGEPFPKGSDEWVAAAIAAGYDKDKQPPDDFAPRRTKRLKADYLAGQVMVAVDKFMQSADREVEEHHFHYIDGIDMPDDDGKRVWLNNNRVRKYLLPFARAMWDDLASTEGCLPYKHDAYVKLWQLGKGADRPIIPADYILLDEAQDTAPVFLDVLKRQEHALLVFVGDSNQAIYEWRGAVDAMCAYPDAPRRLLSQSYRFGQTVADVANAVLSGLDEPTDLVMRGNPDLPSRVGAVASPRCYLYRTNAGVIGQFMRSIDEGKRPTIVGGKRYIEGLIAWCQAAVDLQAVPCRGTNYHELACFDNWAEVVEYSKTDEGADLRLMVKLVTTFGAQEIRDALKNMPDEDEADLVVGTAHKSKGREWDSVKLGPDFPLANKMTDADRRLLYVALTRAKLNLDITECPPFCGGNDTSPGEDGQSTWVPGIEIHYTVDMPTEEDQAEWLAAKEVKQRADSTPTSAAHVQSAVVIPTVTTSVVTTAPASTTAPANGDGFTWTTLRDMEGWFVRGPAEMEPDTRVTVRRRDGTTKSVVIKNVVKRFDDAWVYSIK